MTNMQKIIQDMPIGSNIRKIRKSCGLKQEEVIAQMQIQNSKMDVTTLSKIENGYSNIRASDLILLKDIFKCSYDDFFMIPES